MTAMMLAGMGAQFLGNVLGGNAKKRAAKMVFDAVKQKLKDSTATADFAISQIGADRLAAAQHDAASTGYDLLKLRSEAEAAGFNPLTVLNATGGYGYSRGAFSTPFISMSDAMFRKADLETSHANSLQGGAGQASVDAAGYFGDSISGLGRGLAEMGALKSQQGHEITMQQNDLDARYGTSPFGSRQRQVTVSPVAKVSTADRMAYGPQPSVPVWTGDGWQYLSPGVAARMDMKAGDTMVSEDYQRIYGDVIGEGMGAVDAIAGEVSGGAILRQGPLSGSKIIPPAWPSRSGVANRQTRPPRY